MRVVFGDNEFEIDVDETKKLYKPLPPVCDTCRCIVCRNYYRWAWYSDKPTLDLLYSLGVDYEKPIDLWPLEPGERYSSQRYLCTFPLCVAEGTPMKDWVVISEALSVCIVKERNQWVLKANWRVLWMS